MKTGTAANIFCTCCKKSNTASSAVHNLIKTKRQRTHIISGCPVKSACIPLAVFRSRPVFVTANLISVVLFKAGFRETRIFNPGTGVNGFSTTTGVSFVTKAFLRSVG